MLLKFLYLFLIVLLSVNKVYSARMYWYDTTTDRNPDFDMDDVPDGSIHDGYFDVASRFIPYPFYNLQYQLGAQSVYDQSTNSYVIVHNETTFNLWTSQTEPDYTISGMKDFYVGEYNPTRFFPIDYQGFGNDGENHNYKWCVWIRFEPVQAFSYKGKFYPGFMDIAHSDDLIVYLDGQKIVESIGIIDTKFNSFTIPPAQPWIFHTLDIINCNRKKREDFHLLDFFSDLILECRYIDNCGICEGNNDCICQMGYNCIDDETQCISSECVDSYTCETRDFNCSEVYPDLCKNQFCSYGYGCQSTPVDCNDFDGCTVDSCSPTVGCIHDPIENCTSCGENTPCVTTDPCLPVECHPTDPNQCVMTPVDCTVDEPCIVGFCENGICSYEEVCTASPTEVPISSSDSSSESSDSSSASSDSSSSSNSKDSSGEETTTLYPTTQNTISISSSTTSSAASTIYSTIYSTIISSLTSTLQTTIYTSAASTIETTSFTTTDSSLPTITGSSLSSTVISSIVSSTLSASYTTSSLSGPSTSVPEFLVKCGSLSCPDNYCCIQLSPSSYTCVSKYFENHCEIEKFKLFIK